MSTRIAITGSSGFIGTNLIEHYLNTNVRVLALDKNEPRINHHRQVFCPVNILDLNLLSEELANFNPHIIIHLAARTDLEENPGTVGYEENTTGVQNLIIASRACPNLRLIVFASTRLVFSIDHKPVHDWDYSPTTSYGRSKVIGEEVIRCPLKGPRVPWVIVRPTSIWGPWFGIPYRLFFDLIQKNCYFHPRNQLIKKSFGFVGNAVYQIARIAEADPISVHGQAFFIADYEPIEVGAWSEEIRQEIGAHSILHVPHLVLKLLAFAGDAAKTLGFRNPPITSFRLSNLTTEMVYNLEKTRLIVGKLPFTTGEGIKKTVSWIKDSG